jgi:hypothetical protein
MVLPGGVEPWRQLLVLVLLRLLQQACSATDLAQGQQGCCCAQHPVAW